MHGFARVLLLGAAIGTAWHAPAPARDLFSGTFTVDGQTGSAGATSASDFARLFTDSGLSSLFGGYTTVSAVNADVSLRGVPATLSYQAGSTTLRLQIAPIGVDQSFTGATRDESQDLALRWLRGAGGDAVTRFLQYAVATTPVDPIAGNPNSLMSQMGASDFGAALGGAGRGISPGGRFSAAARFGSYSSGGFDTDVYTLPLGYSFGRENGTELLIDAPLTYVTISGSQSYSGSFGAGLKIPVPIGSDRFAWSLTPMLRAGAVGSVDAGAVGGIWSASVTSVLDVRIDDLSSITMGNMVSRLATLPIDVADLHVSYDITNYMFRNGLIYTRRVGEMFGRQVSASGFIIDTRFTGDALYVNSYQEFGGFLSFGEVVRGPGAPVPLQIGFTVLNGDNGYRGFSLNLGITF